MPTTAHKLHRRIMVCLPLVRSWGSYHPTSIQPNSSSSVQYFKQMYNSDWHSLQSIGYSHPWNEPKRNLKVTCNSCFPFNCPSSSKNTSCNMQSSTDKNLITSNVKINAKQLPQHVDILRFSTYRSIGKTIHYKGVVILIAIGMFLPLTAACWYLGEGDTPGARVHSHWPFLCMSSPYASANGCICTPHSQSTIQLLCCKTQYETQIIDQEKWHQV